MIIHGDCLQEMATLPAESVDAIVTDPPYGLSFMGKNWDRGVPGEAFWREALRVAKPGAHLLAFGGTRTYHRLACAIEDAGWEIRDCIMWVYGSGFPKSHDVSKAIDREAGAEREIVGVQDGHYDNATRKNDKKITHDFDKGRPNALRTVTAPATDAAKQWQGWGTALKPAYEPIIVARKPLVGTVAANVQQYGTGAINVDGCRVGSAVGDKPLRWEHGRGMGFHGAKNRGPCQSLTSSGRWPANFIHEGSDEVLALFPVTKSGNVKPYQRVNRSGWTGPTSETSIFERDGDTGSAARFFKSVSFQEDELLFCRAKAIMAAWNYDFANIADNLSSLPNQHAFSVLSDAVILASHGQLGLSEQKVLFTSVTQSELRRLCEAVITATLSLEKRHLQEPLQEKRIPNGCLVKFAEISKLTGIITITISHWKFDGSADAATYNITPLNLAHGEADLARRAFYCAKASKRDRDEGCEGFDVVRTGGMQATADGSMLTGSGNERTTARANHHPTVKPTDLMRYLCRLVTPPRGIVLDPFMGSGSTGKGAILEGFDFIGIEQNAEYIEIAKARIAFAQERAKQEPAKVNSPQTSLFDTDE